MPGAVGRLLVAQAFNALRVHDPQARLVHVDRFDRVDASLGHDRSVLLHAHYPSRALVSLAERTGVPVAIVVIPPVWCIADLRSSGVDFLQALRLATASVSLLSRAARLASAAFVSVAGTSDTMETVLGAVARALDLPLAVDGLSRRTTLREAIVEHLPAEPVPVLTTQRELLLVGHVLGPLVDGLTAGRPQPVCWPYDVFLSGDEPDTPAPMVMDITGPARTLCYGPYFHLPEGAWRADVIVGFSEDVGDVTFLVELHCGGLVARVRVGDVGPGLFQGAFDLVIEDPAEPIEVRVRNETGAIEGRFSLGQIIFTPRIGEPS